MRKGGGREEGERREEVMREGASHNVSFVTGLSPEACRISSLYALPTPENRLGSVSARLSV